MNTHAAFNLHNTLFVIRLVWILILAVFGLLVIGRKYASSNGGYKRCWKCYAKLSRWRRYFMGTPFCSASCKKRYAIEMRHQEFSRLTESAR